MHLNECLALLATTAHNAMTASSASISSSHYNQTTTTSNSEDLYMCLSNWGFKTTTNFYNNDELILPWWFGALCFSFSVGGIGMLLMKPRWVDKTGFPYSFHAIMLIFVQGPLSFMADYVNMTNDSLYHVIDRFVACSLVSLEMRKVSLMCYHQHPVTFRFYAMAFLFAIFSFGMSQRAQSEENTEGFVVWHAMWHLYPLLGLTVAMVDWFVLGAGYDREVQEMEGRRRDEGENKRKKGKLLSTVVMNTETETRSPCKVKVH